MKQCPRCKTYCTEAELAHATNYDYMGRVDDGTEKGRYYRAYTKKPKRVCQTCIAEMNAGSRGRQPIYTRT